MDVRATIAVELDRPLRLWTGSGGLELDGKLYVGAGGVLAVQPPESALDGGDGSMRLECVLPTADAGAFATAPGPADVAMQVVRRTAAGWQAFGPKWAGVLGAVAATRYASTVHVQAECVPTTATPKYAATARRWSAQDQLERTANQDTALRRLSASVRRRRHSFPRTIRG